MLLKVAATVLVLLATAPTIAQTGTTPTITVVDPWARATPPGAKVGAAYMELKAAAGAADKLLSASSGAAGVTEIHNHIMEGGVARMRRVDAIAVAAGGSVMMKPGGYHVMLMDLKGPLKAGETIQLKLLFETAGEITVDAKVRPIGASGAGSGSGSGAGTARK